MIQTFTQLATGGAYPAITPQFIVEQTILLPSKESLSLFHENMSAIFHRINMNAREIRFLGEIREHLLPKLLSVQKYIVWYNESIIMTNGIENHLSLYDTASLHKEIDLIQNCISRMARNSFLIKSWSITLIVITWAILDREGESCLSLLLLIIPILAFWGLDGYFLRLERMYRKMYEWLLKSRIEEADFSKLYDLNPSRFQTKVASWIEVVLSKTLLSFYFTLVTIVIIGAGIMFCIP